MIFWRQKNNSSGTDQEKKDEKVLHHSKEPDLEPTEDTSDIDDDLKNNELNETENHILDTLTVMPVPEHGAVDDAMMLAEEKQHDRDEEGGGWFSRLSAGLSKSSSRLGQGITDIFGGNKVDEATLQDLEDLLIMADLGPKTASSLVQKLADRKIESGTAKSIRDYLAEDIAEILKKHQRPLNVKKAEDGPRVYLICGVNGVGKTTTIGKLAYQLHIKQGKKVMIAAGDTFRAAAIEQLQVWADRTKCPLVARELGADAAAVAFEAYERAVAENVDILMIDTAGRLHNKANLMAELEKIIRVLRKKNPALPHEAIIILDGTTGQNATAQVETFTRMVEISGLIVTKLDGSAKGGVIVSLADQFDMPIFAVGVGEAIEDLQPFRPEGYAKALVGAGSA